MGGGKKNNGATILRLFKRHGKRCFYCGGKTKLISFNSDGTQKDNKATIEHVYFKLDIRRYLSKKIVLSCYKCNQRKNIIDHAAIFNNDVYRDIFYRDDEQSIYKGLIVNMLKSKDVTRYLI